MRGSVPTPDELVNHMVRLLFDGRAVDSRQRLLDPGCGMGAFMEGVLRWSALTGARPPQITGIEVDSHLTTKAAERFHDNTYTSLVDGNFLEADLPHKYDYIIGNPPYVSILRLDEQEKTAYRSQYSSATGRFDLYMLFFERALEALKPGGRLVFVTPEKFTYVDSGSSLRRLLSSYDIRRLEFLPEDTFGHLATYPLITVVDKRKSSGTTRIINREGMERAARLPRDGASWAPLVNGCGQRTDSPEPTTVLSAICDRISCGIATGADKVFVFKQDDLVEGLHRFAYPTVAGRALDRSKALIETDTVMLVPYNMDGTLAPLEELGSFGRYLMSPQVSARLLERTCVARKPWYAFHETPCMSQLLRPKILCKDIARHPAFWLDRSGTTLPRHSTYYIIPKNESMLEPLCEYLNGKQASDWLAQNCQRAVNGFIRTQSNVLKRLPVPSEFVNPTNGIPWTSLDALSLEPTPSVLELIA